MTTHIKEFCFYSQQSSKMKHIIVIGIFLLLIGCAEEEVVTIGVLGPFTGPLERSGQHMQEGIELAITEINQAGGINGKHIRLIYEDTKCIDLKGTVTALQKLKDIDKVQAIIGPFCGGTNILAGKFSTENNLFIISPGDNFGYTGQYKINTRYPISKESKLLVDYALKQGWKKLALLYSDSEWGHAYRNRIKNYLDDQGGELITEAWTFANLDVRTQLIKIKQAQPDALIITDSTGGLLFKQAKELELKIPLLSEAGIENPGSIIEALEGVIYFFPDIQKTSFRHNYGPTIEHIDSYDAAKILAQALEACPSYTASCMMNYVTQLKDYPGAGGPLTFNETIWAFDKPFMLKSVKDGKFVVLG